MSLRIISIVLLVFFTRAVPADSCTELAARLAAATDPAEIHRLKAQLAVAAVARLEEGDLSKTEREKRKAEALALCADVQLGAMDIWFGESVVAWARLLLLDGDWREARSVLLSQAEVLQNIEKNLAAAQLPVSAISPVAGCRYFLGETYRIEYEQTPALEPAAAALTHFYNVFIKYGDSPWGGLAEQRAEAAKAFVESLGKQVRIDLGEHRDAFIAQKFTFGARLAAQGKPGEAIPHLLVALGFFPESPKSAEALRHLGVCWAGLGEDEMALMAAEYGCERFAADTNAAAAVLAIGREFLARDEAQADHIFEHYLAAFSNDLRRADILGHFAWKTYQAGNLPAAGSWFQSLESELRARGETGERLEKAVYAQADCAKDPAAYDRFLAEFPGSALAPRALAGKAQALLVAGQFDDAFATLEILTQNHPDEPAARTALSGLIVVAVEAGRFDLAGQVLDRMLADRTAYGPEVYLATGEGLLAAGQFALAEKAFRGLPAESPKNQAERALSGSAAARFGLEDFAGCLEAVNELLERFPATGFFYDARLVQARALVKLDRAAEAAEAYGEVVAARQDYAVALEMARILADPEERLAAYQRIALLADPDMRENRPLIAASIVESLPLCLELGKFQLAAASCDQFERLFPENERLPLVAQFRKEAEDALAQ